MYDGPGIGDVLLPAAPGGHSTTCLEDYPIDGVPLGREDKVEKDGMGCV